MIERIEEMRLSAVDRQAIGDLLDSAFGADDFNGRDYHRQRHQVRLIQREGDQIIGHVAVLLRMVSLAGSTTCIAGLAEVATSPNHRGQGIATRLVKAAIEEARQSPADHILLFGDAPLYAALGFRPVSHPLRSVDLQVTEVKGVLDRPSRCLMVLSLKGDWPDGVPLDLLGPTF